MSVDEGDRGKPLIIFVHGLGMDEYIWTDPSSARILGGALPITVLLSEKPLRCDTISPNISIGDLPDPLKLRTIFHDLRDRGYPTVTWSQRRPAGPVDSAVSELAEVMDRAVRRHEGDIVLVCHSRGGLIARKYLAGGCRKEAVSKIRALITVCTPHKGSSLAGLAAYMSPFVKIIAPFISVAGDPSTLKKTMARVTDFIKSSAVSELLPASGFFETLRDGKMDGVRCLTLGGTDPGLFSVYRWKQKRTERGSLSYPEEMLSFPGVFEKIVPSMLYPDEMKKGYGDGLVTAESSRLPWSDEHHDFPLNHAKMLFDKRARETILSFIDANF
ncbi:MAG: alpha/beta fold hydrolase [Nitrospirae bacterium]|nr:alpha/beta fold hydrolase [Nitrospirota bacterium]